MSETVWTIQLPGDDIVLTRYLYLKDEVKNALLIALLEKSKSALFWAYELYYSGFENELIDYVWTLYYDFYAILNVTFEGYLLKKVKEWRTNKDPIIIGNIVDNLLIRPFNTDIFLLRLVIKNSVINIDYKYDCSKLHENIDNWLETENYYSLANEVLVKSTNLNDKLYCIELFEKIVQGDKNVKIFKNIIKYNFVDIRHIILAKCFIKVVNKKGVQKGKSTYVKENDYSEYNTISNIDIRPYNILKHVCKYSIDEFGYQSVFKLNRNKYNIDKFKQLIFDNWIYQASFSPIWNQRIKISNGLINMETKTIDFMNDDCLEDFYNIYNYELDEQCLNVQNKLLQINPKNNIVSDFINKFKINKLITIEDSNISQITKVCL